jgi:hypothetical protein
VSVPPLVVSCGGGVDSSGMLAGMKEHDIQPDLIEFADVAGADPERRGEKPETYAFIDNHLRPWTVKNMGLGIVAVMHQKGDSLRDSCFRNGTLPSKAYGFPGCSVKFKHQLMERYETAVYGPDAIIVKAIGYNAREGRSEVAENGRYRYRYFLREWGWGRAECIAALKRAGLPIPMKSACYFCPSSKPKEIVWLAKNHPELYADAVAMEHQARPYHDERGGHIKGLGRQWSWEQVVKADEQQLDLFPDTDPLPCMCFDGGDEEDGGSR